MNEKENHKPGNKLDHRLVLIVLPKQQRKLLVRPRQAKKTEKTSKKLKNISLQGEHIKQKRL